MEGEAVFILGVLKNGDKNAALCILASYYIRGLFLDLVRLGRHSGKASKEGGHVLLGPFFCVG